VVMAASRLLLSAGPCRVDIPLTRGGWQEMRARRNAHLWPDNF